MKHTQQDKWNTLLFKFIGWFCISLLVLILLAFVVGGPFRPILGVLGLEIQGFGGVFINCNDPANHSKDFCRPLMERRKGGRRGGKSGFAAPDGPPFSL